MTRQKNALRGHFVAPYNNGTEPASAETWLELAKWITDVSDDTDEKTEDQAFYDGDGTEETSVISVKVLTLLRVLMIQMIKHRLLLLV